MRVSRDRRQQLAYAVVVLLGAFGFWRVEDTANDLAHLVEDTAAARCIRDWQSVENVREAIVIPGEAIIEVSPDVDPERVEQFRAVVNRRVAEAYPDPSCDLDAARRRLGVE